MSMKGFVAGILALVCVVSYGQVGDASNYRQGMARMQADMRVLQEDMVALLRRIEQLEQDKLAALAQIQNLRDTVARYERRFQDQERVQQVLEQRLRTEIANSANESERARRQSIENLQKAIAGELRRIEQLAVKATNSAAARAPRAVPSGTYVEIEVRSGDTLSAIASAAGVSVQALKQLNGLQGNTIHIGQKLKVPAPAGQ